MALTHRRQHLAKFIKFHDHTAESFAAEVSKYLRPDESVDAWAIRNIAYGRKHPTAREIRAIELAFGGSLPIQTMLEETLLRSYNGALRLECER